MAVAIDAATAMLTYSMSKESLNIRAAFLHNLADALASVVVIVAGTLIILYDWRLLDPLATLLISGYILWHALKEMKPTIRILMLGTPPEHDRAALAQALMARDVVEDVHHVHLWQIDERRVSLEAHVVLAEGDLGRAPEIVTGLKEMLERDFGIGHATIEVETRASGCASAEGGSSKTAHFRT